MTSNNNLKSQARDYATKHGVSYAQARREIIEANTPAAETGFEPQRILILQQEQRDDFVLPYPFHIDEHGFVGRQDVWRGEPFQLLGFVESPDSFDVAVLAAEFIANPTLAMGMHPVLVDRADNFYTYPGPVASANPYTSQRAKPETVTVRYRTTDEQEEITVGVGHLKGLLNSDDFDGPMAQGVISDDALVAMLGWLRIDDGGQDAAAFFGYVDAFREDLAADDLDDSLTAAVHAEQIEALSSGTQPG